MHGYPIKVNDSLITNKGIMPRAMLFFNHDDAHFASTNKICYPLDIVPFH
jgi:hypothetical protein